MVKLSTELTPASNGSPASFKKVFRVCNRASHHEAVSGERLSNALQCTDLLEEI